MIHMTDEEISKMIEGNISKKERKMFKEHLSHCDSCLSIYTETLAFLVEEEKQNSQIRPHITQKIGELWQSICIFFKTPRYSLVLASSIVIIVITILALLQIPTNSKTDIEKITMITAFAKTNVNKNIYSHSANISKEPASLRIGILIEDLSFLVHTSGTNKLRADIIRMLNSQLRTFVGDKHPLIREIKKIQKSNVNKIIKHIRQIISKEPPCLELFKFGRFVEHSFLSTFEGTVPNTESIKKHLPTARRQGFPHGVLEQLEKLSNITNLVSVKDAFAKMKNILSDL